MTYPPSPERKCGIHIPRGSGIISSRGNPLIKQIRGLAQRKERERTGLFFVEGARLVATALEAQADVEALVAAPELLDSPFGRKILQGPCRSRAPCLRVTPEVFGSLAAREDSQGIGAVVRQRWHTFERAQPSRTSCWIALDSIQYPGNLGTILRVSDAVGGAGVLLIGSTADPYDPLAVRASTGAIFSQRVVRIGLGEFASWKKRYGCTVVGASPSATLDYREVVYSPPAVLFMGCERRGLSAERLALCDLVVKIPMVGWCDSLNLAMATGLVLYEIFHQSRRPVAGSSALKGGVGGAVR